MDVTICCVNCNLWIIMENNKTTTSLKPALSKASVNELTLSTKAEKDSLAIGTLSDTVNTANVVASTLKQSDKSDSDVLSSTVKQDLGGEEVLTARDLQQLSSSHVKVEASGSPQNELLQPDIVKLQGNVVGNGTMEMAKPRKSSFQITSVTGLLGSKSSLRIHNDIIDTADDLAQNSVDTWSDAHDNSCCTGGSDDTGASIDTLRSRVSDRDSEGSSTNDFLSSSIDNVFNLSDSNLRVPECLFAGEENAVPTAGSLHCEMIETSNLPRSVITTDVARLASASINSVFASSHANDLHSRFKIIKILNHIRGRWKCFDFAGTLPGSAGANCADSKTLDRLTAEHVDGSVEVSSICTTQNFGNVDRRTTVLDANSESRHANGIDGINRPGINSDLGNEVLADSVATDSIESAAAAAASSLALDNKIEQAMDLVKTHLMFAVHEEVELLKEQIKELMLKNVQLEYENSILRTSATSDTISKLQASPPFHNPPRTEPS